MCFYTAREQHRTLNTTLTSYLSGKSFNYLSDLRNLRLMKDDFPTHWQHSYSIYLHYAVFRKAPHLSCLTKTLKIIQFDYIVDPFMINLSYNVRLCENSRKIPNFFLMCAFWGKSTHKNRGGGRRNASHQVDTATTCFSQTAVPRCGAESTGCVTVRCLSLPHPPSGAGALCPTYLR